MKYSLKYKMLSTVFAFGVLSGCGTYVPEIQELPGSPDDGQLLVREIVRSVHCEVQQAIQYVINTDKDWETFDTMDGYMGRPDRAQFGNR
jgi:hypothetical protein